MSAENVWWLALVVSVAWICYLGSVALVAHLDKRNRRSSDNRRSKKS